MNLILNDPMAVSLTVSELPEKIKMGVEIDEEPIFIDMDTVIQIVSGDDYTGEYEVTPIADGDILLPTKDKFLIDDVRVHEIPYYEVSNPSGGETVYIANEVGING